MSQGDDRPQPEGNGVTGHLLLTSFHGDKQGPQYLEGVLLHPEQVFPKGPDGPEQQFIPVISDEVVKGQHREFLKTRVKNRRILGLSHEVRKEREGTGPPSA